VRMRGGLFTWKRGEMSILFMKNVKIFGIDLLLVVANREYSDLKTRTKIRAARNDPLFRCL
jgi:hypothetical protein